MSVTGSIIAGVGLAGSIGGAAIEGNAAQSAASDQSQAADQAAELQYQASQNALGFQEQEYNQSQQNLQPWLQSGSGALSNLDYMLGITPQMTGSVPAGQSTFSPTQFNASAPGGQPSGPTQPGRINPGYGAAPTSGGPVASTAVSTPSNLGSALQRVEANGGSAPVGGTPTTPLQSGNNGVAPGSNPYSQNPQSSVGSPAAYTPSAKSIALQGSAPTLGSLPGGAPGATSTGSSLQPFGGASTPTAVQRGGSFTPPPSGSGTAATGTSAANPSSPSTSFGSLLQPYSGSFTAPTAQQALNSPGEQAQLTLGEQALQQSAAASGNLLTGGTAEALNNYAQNVASTGYQNAYNNAYNTYATNYNQYEQQQNNDYNRLASIAGVGQTAANQLGSIGQGASNNVTSNLLGTAQAQGQDYQNAAAANASGVVGQANAYGGALSGATSNLSQLALLSQLYGGGGGAGITSADALGDSEYL